MGGGLHGSTLDKDLHMYMNLYLKNLTFRKSYKIAFRSSERKKNHIHTDMRVLRMIRTIGIVGSHLYFKRYDK